MVIIKYVANQVCSLQTQTLEDHTNITAEATVVQPLPTALNVEKGGLVPSCAAPDCGCLMNSSTINH